MDRRDALAVLLALGAAPLASFAQPQRKVWRIGSVHGVGPAIGKQYVDAFLAGMAGRGYVSDRDFILDSRSADGDPGRYAALIEEVIAQKPDLLIGANTAVAQQMKSRTQSIPIVLATSGDPVGDGLVQSIARPGGNVTGVSLQLGELGGKHVELIRELVPRARRIALLADQAGPQYQNDAYEGRARSAAATTGASIHIHRSRTGEAVEEMFRALAAHRPDALIVFLSPRLNSLRREIARHALNVRLPAIAHQEGFAQDGGLMSYGPSFTDAWRHVAHFVDRIIKGGKPAELPIEQPTKFTLLVNGLTANSLGIKLPQSILIRADSVIE